MAATTLPYKITTANGSDQRAAVVLLNTLIRHVNNGPTTAAAAVGIATTTSKIRTNGTCPFMVDGVFYSKTSTDNLWTISGTSSAASQVAIFLLYLDAAGAATTAQVGPYATEALCIAALPALPDAKALIASLRISTSAAQTFVPGTDVLGTGNTATYHDGGYAGYCKVLADEATGAVIEGIFGSPTNT